MSVLSDNLIAAILALLSALTIAWGTVIRHQLADNLAEDTSTLGGVAATIGQARWWFGSALAMLGYALQLAALGFGTLLLVQPLLVLKLMFTLPLAARLSGYRISRRELTWAIGLTIAVAALVVLGRPAAIGGDISPRTWLVTLIVGVSVLVACCGLAVFAGNNVGKHEHGRAVRLGWGLRLGGGGGYVSGPGLKALLLGTATGWLYGFVALLSKAVVDIYNSVGVAASLVLSWQLWLLVGLSLIGVAIQQAAFNAGSLQKSLPAMTIVEPLVAFSLGYLVLNEQFQATGGQRVALVVAIVVMVVATFELARDSARSQDAEGAGSPQGTAAAGGAGGASAACGAGAGGAGAGGEGGAAATTSASPYPPGTTTPDR